MKKGIIFGAFIFSASMCLGLASCGNSGVTNDTLVIGMECGYQPFNWTTRTSSDYTLPISGTTGEYADGYDVQVAKRLGGILDRPVEIHRIVWDNLITSLQNDQINIILAGMSYTDERAAQINFSNPYLTSDLAFLVRKDYVPAGNSASNPLSYEDLLELFSGHNLICQSAVVGDDYIQTYFTDVDSTIIHSNPVATYPLAAMQVAQGTAFAMPAELPVVEAMINLDSDNLAVLYVEQDFIAEDDLTGLSVNVGIKKGNEELLNDINSALAQISNSERGELMGEAAIRSANA